MLRLTVSDELQLVAVAISGRFGSNYKLREALAKVAVPDDSSPDKNEHPPIPPITQTSLKERLKRRRF
jgi:hypothetical protein